jgi:curved DNA-binding protein CbpA
MMDYYEFLQISPNADSDTIHRVYRFLATRFHPDHPESGDSDTFQLLKAAYDVLSDPARRAEYDIARKNEPSHDQPLSTSIDFMDNLDGELNRRVAVLAVLYQRRRTKPEWPEVALVEIETRMGFPRDYLDFTLWYLVRKGYVTRADNAQFSLTADGVDFVETQRGNVPALNKMLTSGSGYPSADTAQTRIESQIPDAMRPDPRSTGVRPDQGPIILPSDVELLKDRRVTAQDRRVNKGDRRGKPGGRGRTGP